MRHALTTAALLFTVAFTHAEPPKELASGLRYAISVAVGQGGRVFVAVASARGDVESGIYLIENGKGTIFAKGLNPGPGRLVAFQQWLLLADGVNILRVDSTGKSEKVVSASSFPRPISYILDIIVDQESGQIYAIAGREGVQEDAIYRIAPNGKVAIAFDYPRSPDRSPTSLTMDGASHLIVSETMPKRRSAIRRIRLVDGATELLAEGNGTWTGLAWDHFGRLYFADHQKQRNDNSDHWKSDVYVIPRPGAKPVVLASGFVAAHRLCIDASGKNLLVTDSIKGTVTSVPISIPGHEVDTTPLPLHTEVAFPGLKWTGWQGETESGKPNPLRPIVLTHAGDGSGRVVVATQHGVIHHFPNDQKAARTTVFLDIQDRVSYRDDQNEEGFLGLAFHPKFKDNGEFFVFYTPKREKMTNLVSRFRVRKDDPTRADPDSEEVIIRFKKPFWNHDGGTILFGPDGYLYVTHGDGGAANDPYDNGQKMNSWLGKILRLDVDSPTRISKEKNYAVSKDNPFVGKAGVCPEIWAAGLRNVWRMAFDSKTGKLWAGDVGQNLWEEINIIEKGGNYGWNRREGLHPFGAKGTGPRKEFVDPIWEYHHDIGKSITGGNVYRGTRLPEIEGHYLYADYVSGKIWALKYDEAKGRVVANRPIKDRALPIMSFGEDDQGEVYMMTMSATGQGIYRMAK